MLFVMKYFYGVKLLFFSWLALIGRQDVHEFCQMENIETLFKTVTTEPAEKITL